MTWDAASRTMTARVAAVVDNLPALLVAAGLPAIADDAACDSGLAVYDSPRVSYASPCVEVMPVEGPLVHKGAATITTMTGWVSLSFQTTDPAEMTSLSIGYLTALVAAFSGPCALRDESWEVNFATMSPASKQGDSTFVQAVAVKVGHRLMEAV